MLKKRIIPCLDIIGDRTVKGTNFLNLKDAGDPIELSKRYIDEGADELIYLDINATIDNKNIFIELIENIAKNVNIPFTVGGGIKALKDVEDLIKSGADKITINSSAIDNPTLISNISNNFGSQCLVVAVDIKEINGAWKVFVKGGREETNFEVIEWVKIAEKHGAGEILLTSMDGDGTKKGFSVEITKKVANSINIPVIASGWAGQEKDFFEIFTKTRATGALAASVFHYNKIKIPDLKLFLTNKGIPLRWKLTLKRVMD